MGGEALAAVRILDDLIHGGDGGSGEFGAALAEDVADFRDDLGSGTLGTHGEIHGHGGDLIDAFFRRDLAEADFDLGLGRLGH